MRPATRILVLVLAGLLPMWLVACERTGSSSGGSEAGDQSSAIQPDSDAQDDIARQDDPQPDEDDYIFIRVCSYNIEDLRYDDILAATRNTENEGANRARDAARLIAALDPDILLVNEIEFDFISAEPLSGRAFAQLIRQQRAELGMKDREYSVFQEPSNTGDHSGHDLNRDGVIDPMPGSRDYGNDSWGYGEFPGHYAMAMFVASPLEIDADRARTFRKVRWSDMPEALVPVGDGETVPSDEPWYSDEILEDFPLSSKSHWDVPVRLDDGSVIRVLASHPTPPVFDGPEDRNGRRNHDEIRFWAEYLSGADWIRGDDGNPAPAPTDAVLLLGDLNADPIAGDSLDDPVTTWLLRHPKLNGYFVPESSVQYQVRGRDLRSDATAQFGLRVDYVIPSKGILVARGGVVRGEADLPYQIGIGERMIDTINYAASDHFPVWLDIRLPDENDSSGPNQ